MAFLIHSSFIMFVRLIGGLALLCVLVNGLSDSFAMDFDGGVSVTLLHALDTNQPDHFTFRGNLTISRSSTNIVQEPLTSEERQNLKNLAEKNSFYRLKAIVTYTDGSTASFLTFTKAVSGVKIKHFHTICIMQEIFPVRTGQVPANGQPLDLTGQ